MFDAIASLSAVQRDALLFAACQNHTDVAARVLEVLFVFVAPRLTQCVGCPDRFALSRQWPRTISLTMTMRIKTAVMMSKSMLLNPPKVPRKASARAKWHRKRPNDNCDFSFLNLGSK
jgi:predicted metal-binding protein